MVEDYNDPYVRLQRLASEDRAKWMRANDLINEVSGIARGMTCLDFGCGAGVLSFPMVSAVGSEGIVYAVDNNAQVFERIQAKNPPSNLILVQKDAGQTGLDSQIADFCAMALILHETDYPDKVLAEAFRLLKSGGKAVVLEWRMEFEAPNHPKSERISKEKMESMLQKAGFSNSKSTDWTDIHYIAVCYKKKMH